jgi:AcrR family transcriptional regulator
MRGFDDDERERIREALVAAGREKFARYGLAKTTIAELTDAVGIADSTFYRFFDAKEDLYLEVLEREGEGLGERVVAESFERYDDPEAAIVAFLEAIIGEIETNPLVRRLIVEDELDRLREHLTEAELAADREESLGYILPFVEQWAAEGELVDEDPEVLAGAIRAVAFVTLHEDDVGERYPEVRDALIRAVARGVTE